jgi:hypothetical protein
LFKNTTILFIISQYICDRLFKLKLNPILFSIRNDVKK